MSMGNCGQKVVAVGNPPPSAQFPLKTMKAVASRFPNATEHLTSVRNHEEYTADFTVETRAPG